MTIEDLWTCEAHPALLWSGAHSDADGPTCPDRCAGPGMPLSASLDLLRDVAKRLQWWAGDNSPHDVQFSIQRYVDEFDWVDTTGETE